MAGERQGKAIGREGLRPVAREARAGGGRFTAARGVWDRVLDIFGFAEEDEEAAAGTGQPGDDLAAVRPFDPAEVYRRREYRSASGRERTLLTLPGGAGGAQGWRMAVYRPVSLEDTRAAADHLKGTRPVIINLERADRETRQRIMDFLSGVLYAVDGSLYQVGPGVMLLAPANVGVTGLEAESR